MPPDPRPEDRPKPNGAKSIKVDSTSISATNGITMTKEREEQHSAATTARSAMSYEREIRSLEAALSKECANSLRIVTELVPALEWIEEFARLTNEHGIVHPGFTHVERRARAALEVVVRGDQACERQGARSVKPEDESND